MSERMFVATRKGLFTFQRNTTGWWQTAADFLGTPISSVLHDPRSKSVYAGLNHGHFGVKLHRSDDDGSTWNEITCPSYPPKPEDLEDVEPMRQRPIPWNVELIWSLAAGETDSDLWCGTIPGGLFHSSDRGESWTLNRALWEHPKRKVWFGGGYDFPGIHSICVDPRNPHHVTVGVSCGGAWQTKDNGASWTIASQGMIADYLPPEQADDPHTQDPHLIVQSPANPDHFWTQHHSGVFRSTDNCQSWQQVTGLEPSSFGFAVAVHPKDVDTAWFAPAVSDAMRYPVDGKFVINKTTDGGTTSQIQQTGLPDGNSYDLVYRHAMVVDGTGQQIAVGSTTGSLWVSEDEGESFVPISANLPPIYAIQFVEE